jgi:hypothetical protein
VEVGKQLCDLLDLMHSREPPLLCNLWLEQLYLAADQQTVRLLPELRCTTLGVKQLLGRLRERLEGIGARMIYELGMAPPERILGHAEPRSDFFSLAGVLFSLLTGRQAEGHFTGLDLFRSLAAIPAGERWLYELIAINLSEEVRDRYYSARAFRADLMRRAVTRRVTCPYCAQGNPVRQPNCGRCSRPLTDSAPRGCPKCGERYRMGIRSCPKCGTEVGG